MHGRGSASREARAALRAAAVVQAVSFVLECRAIWAMLDACASEDVEFLHGEIAGELHLAPATAMGRLNTALGLRGLPRLVTALETGRLGAGHAQAVLAEVSHLDAPTAVRVVDAVLGDDSDGVIERTGGQLRGDVKTAIERLDAAAANKRHEQARKTAAVRGRSGVDGMGQIVVDCTASEMVTALAALKNRAQVMPFDDPELTQGQKQVAVALGLSDHPATLTGYGPIGAAQARALLPAADLVKACVDASTGEVLAVERPVRAKNWQAGDPELHARCGRRWSRAPPATAASETSAPASTSQAKRSAGWSTCAT